MIGPQKLDGFRESPILWVNWYHIPGFQTDFICVFSIKTNYMAHWTTVPFWTICDFV